MNAIRHCLNAAGNGIVCIVEIHVGPPKKNVASLVEWKVSV
jgi:hypothetical protein